MEAGAFVEIGRVAKTHGLAGEVSVILTADLPVARLVGLEVWFVPPPARIRSARVESVRPGPKGPLFTFEGISDIALAELLRERSLLARSVDLPEVAEEFDPVGYRVIDADRGDIGEITGVIVTGANDVWVVQGPYGEVLVPDIDDVIGDIDDKAATVAVTLLPGLIDEKD